MNLFNESRPNNCKYFIYMWLPLQCQNQNGFKQYIFVVSHFSLSNSGMHCAERILNYVFGITNEVDEEQERKLKMHMDKVASLKQNKYAKIGLNIGLVIILSLGVFLYIFFSFWKYEPNWWICTIYHFVSINRMEKNWFDTILVKRRHSCTYWAGHIPKWFYNSCIRIKSLVTISKYSPAPLHFGIMSVTKAYFIIYTYIGKAFLFYITPAINNYNEFVISNFSEKLCNWQTAQRYLIPDKFITTFIRNWTNYNINF